MSGPAAEKYVLIDDFLLDCALKENHTFDSEVTDYPVESGSNISDNIRPRPITVEIEGLITNTPIGAMVENRIFEGDSDKLPTLKVYERLQAIRDNRKTITISTSLRTYDSMALKGLSIPRGDHHNDMKFTAVFQQIQTVENKRTIRVSIPIASNGGGGKGKKTVTKPPVTSSVQFILIDRYEGKWYDPDATQWRFSAAYKQVGGYYDGEYKWHLSRGLLVGTNETQAQTLNKPGGGLILTRDGQIKPVPIEECVHDFSITSTNEKRRIKAWE